MYKKLRKKIARNLLNSYGWQTNRKIIVIESDDWGSIRMPSKDVFDKFINKGIPVDRSPYCKYDSLANEDDLNALFNTLKKYRDSKNNHPVITANVVVANPDFDKIRASGFKEYYFELITDTFNKYPKHSNCFNLWKEGKAEDIFYPQFHGKEHLNINFWLQLLQNKHPDFLFAFENNCWGLSSDIYPDMGRSVQAAFDAVDQNELNYQQNIIRHGCKLFNDLFGYKSKSFIANNFIWDPSLNRTLFECGVRYLQGMKYQKKPLFNDKDREMIRHYIGEKNDLSQYYLVRNCTFEPSQKESNYDNIGECMKEISNAFFWKRPAIISSHRLNYIGHINPQNRIRNLSLLDSLLKNIIRTWPEVEFLTSDELGDIIKNEKN